MEMIDIFDENMKHIGAMEKDEAHEKKQWHKNSHIWITDGDSVLMQLRGKHVKNFPLTWDISAAGHFQAGETALQGAKRELKEELGIDWSFGDINEGAIIHMDMAENGAPIYEHIYLYFLKIKLDISELKLQAEELEDVKWISWKEFQNFINSDEVVPFPEYYWDAVKEGLWKLLNA